LVAALGVSRPGRRPNPAAGVSGDFERAGAFEEQVRWQGGLRDIGSCITMFFYTNLFSPDTFETFSRSARDVSGFSRHQLP